MYGGRCDVASWHARRTRRSRRVRRLHRRGPAATGRCTGDVGRGARLAPGAPPRLPCRAAAARGRGRERAVRRAERPLVSRDVDLRLRPRRGRATVGRRPVRGGGPARVRRDGVVDSPPARSPSRSPTPRSANAARCPTTETTETSRSSLGRGAHQGGCCATRNMGAVRGIRIHPRLSRVRSGRMPPESSTPGRQVHIIGGRSRRPHADGAAPDHGRLLHPPL